MDEKNCIAMWTKRCFSPIQSSRIQNLFQLSKYAWVRTWSCIWYNPTQSHNEFKSLTFWIIYKRSDLNLACVKEKCVIYDGHSAICFLHVWISISMSPQILFVVRMMRMISIHYKHLVYDFCYTFFVSLAIGNK